jgi:hypothetical protein
MAHHEERPRTTKELLAASTESQDRLVAAMDKLIQQGRRTEQALDALRRDVTRDDLVVRLVRRSGSAIVLVLVAIAIALWRCVPPAPQHLRDDHGDNHAPPPPELADARPVAVDMLPPAEEKPKKPKNPKPKPDPDGDVTTDPKAGHHQGTMSRNAECRDVAVPRADCTPVPEGAER